MHEILKAVLARLLDMLADADADELSLGFGDMVITSDGQGAFTSEEDVMLFSLVLVNSAIELGGEAIGKHPKLLRLIQDDLFFHLIHYATEYSPLVLSMICSTALNLYHFLRR